MRKRGCAALIVGVIVVGGALVAADFAVKSTIESAAQGRIEQAVDQSLGAAGSQADVSIHQFPVLLGLARQEIEDIDATVTIPYSELAAAAQSRIGDAVSVTGVRPGDNVLLIDGSVAVLGMAVAISASYTVDIQPRGATLTPAEFTVAGGTGGDQVQQLLRSLIPAIELSFDQLPPEATITGVTLEPQGVVAHVSMASYQL